MALFSFDREKRQEAARIKELRDLLGQVEQADFWDRVSSDRGSDAQERDSFQQAIARRANALSVTPEKLLSKYVQQLRESTYPTQECLEADQVQAIVAQRAPTIEQSRHLQNCTACRQLLEACQQNPVETKTLMAIVQEAAAEAAQSWPEELQLTDFDFPTAIDSTLTLVEEWARPRGITLHRAVDERLGRIRADEPKIREVVLNLLSNAIKVMPAGGRIEVRAAPVDQFVEVSVNNTGGLAKEDQEAVFEEFWQTGTSAAKTEGTALGLALCRRFVEQHGGKMWVRRAVGAGSTYAFRVPLRSESSTEHS